MSQAATLWSGIGEGIYGQGPLLGVLSFGGKRVTSRRMSVKLGEMPPTTAQGHEVEVLPRHVLFMEQWS